LLQHVGRCRFRLTRAATRLRHVSTEHAEPYVVNPLFAQSVTQICQMKQMKRRIVTLVCALQLICFPCASTFAQPPVDDVQRSFVDNMRSFLLSRRFAELDAASEQLSRTKERFPGGDWKLYRFYGAVGRPGGGGGDLNDRAVANVGQGAQSDEVWQHHIALLREWRSQNPTSSTAKIALGDSLISYAWKARGAGYSSTVTDDASRLFIDRLTEAKAVLTESRSAMQKDPQWYSEMIDLARGLGWEAADVSQLVERASSVEPLYQHTYSAAARYLTPRWYGEPGEWERFADHVAEKLGGRQGPFVYGHIALQMSALYGAREFFAQNHISWERLKQSLADREALYGVDLHTLNAMSLLATFIKDYETARALFAQIGDKWDPTIWRERRYFDNYRTLAVK
jgi:hypothetical protein